MTYTCMCFISRKKSNCIKYKNLKRIELENSFNFDKHLYTEIENKNGWYIKNRHFVKKVESTGTPFGNIYNTKSGIATLKNSVYIFKETGQDEEFYFIDDEIKIEKAICRDIINSNFLVKTDDKDSFIERIIFPYYYDDKNVKVIEIDDLKNEYPFAYKYLLSKKEELATRDKGKGKDYKYWYAFGRNQSLERTKYKLLFPQLAKEGFKSSISDDENLYFYNGMAAMSDNKEELELLQQIFKTDIFWLYVKSISKPYASNYLSLGRNYMKNFGVYNFSKEERDYIINEDDINQLNIFFSNKYK